LTVAARACFRHPLRTLAGLALLTVLATVGVARTKIDPDISELLPASHESVRNLEALRAQFGGVGYVALVVRGGTPEARRAFADQIVPKLEQLPTVGYATARVPIEFFRERALYFLDLPDLQTVLERLEARQRYDIERAMLDLDDEPPPSIDFGDLTQEYQDRLGSPAHPIGSSGYYEDASTLLILVRPEELASNLEFARRTVSEVESALAEQRARLATDGLEVDVAGRYKKRVDLQAVITRDLAWTSSVALLLVLAYVTLHFRRLLAVVLIILPLLVGMQLSYGFAGFTFGTLNILTAFIGAILLGIGIDNGIHLLGRHDEALAAGHSPEAAIGIAFADAGRISMAATLSIAAAFGCLALSDFGAFREFGVLMAIGMLWVAFAYLTLLPALLGAVTRYSPQRPSPRPALRLPGVAFGIRQAPRLTLIAGLLSVGLLSAAPLLRFNADFAALDRADSASFRLDPTINRLLGRSQTPLVFLTADAAEARELSQALRSRMATQQTHATIGLVSTLGDWVPSQMAEKQTILARIRRVLSRIDPARLTSDEQRRFDDVWEMAQALPFTRADLPESLRKQLSPRSGDAATELVLAHPLVSMGEASAVLELERQLTGIELASGRKLTAAGEPMVMAEILRIVKHDAPKLVLLTFLLILVVLRLTTGRMRLALLSLLPAVLTLGTTAGLLFLLGIDLNYINMIMLPILLGISVDDAMHIVTRHASGDDLATVWGHTGWNIVGAILTDAFGFGVLAFAEHAGLASLGQVALVGLTANLVLCVIFLPALLAVLARRRGRVPPLTRQHPDLPQHAGFVEDAE
jgi:predicted RND superfamily exporter protein